jgi:hypothetical protein
MKERMLALFGTLALGTGSVMAQQAPSDASLPMPTPTSPAPATGPAPFRGMGPQWDRSWEAIVFSAARPTPPPQPDSCPPPEEPESPANRAWFSADYLMWWTKDGPLPTPLLTTGSPSATIIGGLTQPGTAVLFGGSDQSYGLSSGLRFDIGLWLDEERRWGLDAGLFLLEQRSTGLGVSSSTTGSPVLAQPLINATTGQEFTEVIALPGLIAGAAAITTHSRLQGWEINGLANLFRTERLAFDVLVGFRAVKLDEDVTDLSTFSPLVPSLLTFSGQPVSTGSRLSTYDSFQAQNKFYGLQVGARAEWNAGPLTVSALAKFALGGEQELVRVVGESGLSEPGAMPVAVPGGVLAVASNIGRHFRDEFAVLPEVGLQVRYRISTHLEARFGYSLLYLSSVARPGDQFNRTVDPSLVPTDPAFRTGGVTPSAFQIRSSDYWAQGLNFGLALRF